MKYLVFDLETETHTAYKRKASCFDARNWVVARGWKKQGDLRNSYTYHPKHDRSTYLKIDPDVGLLVGFNLKFDLLWEMAQGNPDLLLFFQRGGKIWDCQYVQYLLKGQTDDVQMCSMDSIIESYGGRKKIDEVKILWNAGVQTSAIPEDLLIDYLIGTEDEQRNSGDVGNTELIFRGQIVQAMAQKQVLMIEDRMDGLLSTIDMEFRGLKIDVAEAGRRLQVLNADLAEQKQALAGHLPPMPFDFNWSSRTQVSCLIFGGTVKYSVQTTYTDPDTGQLARKKATEKVPIGHYVSGARKGEVKYKLVPVEGELKVKYQDFFHTLPGYTQPKPEWKLATTDGADQPLYSTGGDIIAELSLTGIPFLKALAKKQSLDKEIGTYYVVTNYKGEHKGMLVCVQTGDHIIHHKLNHSSTVTTRLSSSDPNLQNLPKASGSEVKRMFVSRFGAAGCMLEADYSQLEVVVQGVLSGDEALCKDLRDKIDFHCKRVSAKFHITYEEALEWCKNEDHPDYKNGSKERTTCKVFSFQRAYGAGAVTIAIETGIPVDDIKQMIEAEELMYPGVVRFNADVESVVMKSSIPFKAANDNGDWRTFRRGRWVAPTGTIYSFRTWDAPAFLKKKGIEDSYSPPELKNYPVQGTGGEFVQAMSGKLWRHFVAKNFYGGLAFLVNTVHDCIWVDCHKSVRDEVAADMKRIMESIPEFYNTRHGMNIIVPFPVSVETGPNMYELKHWVKGQWAEAA